MVDMTIETRFSELSPAKQVALLYAVGSWTQKTLFDRFGVSYGEYRQARDELTKVGVLGLDGTLSATAWELVPGWAWREIRTRLTEDLERARENERRVASDNLQLRTEIVSLKVQLSALGETNEELRTSVAENQAFQNMFTKFAPMGLTANWIRSVISLTLVECAIKAKLEKLGHAVKEGIGFNDLLEALELNLREREGRQLGYRLIGLPTIRQMRHKISHDGHRLMGIPTADADAVENVVADLVDELRL
jgi:hypothetical protein